MFLRYAEHRFESIQRAFLAMCALAAQQSADGCDLKLFRWCGATLQVRDGDESLGLKPEDKGESLIQVILVPMDKMI
jgi:hypothetical protein